MNKLLNYKITFGKYSFSSKDLITHPLFSGSAVMVLGTNFANFFAYIYHVIIGRIFGPESYGALAATLSLIGVVASAVTFFSVVVTKFISSSDKKEKEKLFSWFLSRALILGGILCVISFLMAKAISDFIHVDLAIILLIGPIFFVTLLSLIFKAFLQGILRFKQSVIVNNIEMVGRLLFALVFIYLGFEVFGAILGLFISTLVGVFLGRFYLKAYHYTGFKKSGLDTSKVIAYSFPILISSLSINAILSADVILAKHFFSPKDAGIYASIATIGRIIFFGTSPISSVMFPMISQKHANGEKYIKIFLLSLFMTFLAGGFALLLFYVLPQLAVRSLYGDNYIEAASNIFWYGLFMLLFSLANVILNYYLSIGRTKLVIFPMVAAFVQVAGIWMYHDSLFSVIQVSIIVSLLLFISLLIYFLYETRKAVSK